MKDASGDTPSVCTTSGSSAGEFGSDVSTLMSLGNLDVIGEPSKIGFVSSVRCPGNLILRTYDLARELRDSGRTVIGGFHSPMEREFLYVLLKGRQPVVICLARSLNEFRVPPEWRQALVDRRLLIVSAFPYAVRVTVEHAVQRNVLVASLSEEVFIGHAEQGSKTEALARRVVAWGKPLLTFPDPNNDVLVALGAKQLVLPQVDLDNSAVANGGDKAFGPINI